LYEAVLFVAEDERINQGRGNLTRRCQPTTLNSKNAFGKQPRNERANSKLKPSEYFAQTRDLLVPKLISGELDVENLNINTGNIAA